MRVLVTRPEKDSAALAESIRRAGHEAIVSPLLDIVPVGWEMPETGISALVLTSQNAVTPVHADILNRYPCFCIGAATAEAARAAGYDVIAHAEGDRAGLIAALAARKLKHVLFLSGHVERADLVAELAAVDILTTKRIVYEAQARTAFSPDAAHALADNSIDCILLFSPRSAEIFCNLLQSLPGVQQSRLTLACLSAAVAEACGTGWSHITLAQQPSTQHLLAAAGILCDRPPDL
jgi:uroporphyrinogen-III synthase